MVDVSEEEFYGNGRASGISVFSAGASDAAERLEERSVGNVPTELCFGTFCVILRGSIFSRMFNIIGHHHGKLEGERVLKGTDVQPELFLKLLKAVHQCVAVNIELA